MAQADLNVANQSGSAFRADLNNQLLALGTLMSGASEPSTTYAYMLWADTANGLLKQRNAANSAWITVRNLDGTYARGTAGTPSVPFDGGTGIYSPGEDQVAIATGGTGRLFVDASGRILAGVSTALTNAYSIGTALAPAVQLEGNTGNAAALSITRHASAASNLLLQRGVIGTPVAADDAVGQINFNGFDGTNYFNAALIRGVVDSTPGSGSMPGRLSFQTTPSGSTTPIERIRIDASGNINMDGGTLYVDATNNRAGIGTSSPDRLLHLSGADTAYLRLENQDTTGSVDQYVGLIEFEGQDAGGSGVRAQIGAESGNLADIPRNVCVRWMRRGQGHCVTMGLGN